MGMLEEEHTQREPSPTDTGLILEATADTSPYTGDGFVRWTANYKHIPRPRENNLFLVKLESSNARSYSLV